MLEIVAAAELIEAITDPEGAKLRRERNAEQSRLAHEACMRAIEDGSALREVVGRSGSAGIPNSIAGMPVTVFAANAAAIIIP
jgi:hypothetical protein